MDSWYSELELPPLPADLEMAHRELRYWQKQVGIARQQVAKTAERRAQDNRAHKGEVSKMMGQILQLHGEITNLNLKLKDIEDGKA